MTQLAIVADDLTGAADSAALFAEAGFATVVPLVPCPDLCADVVSVSTESRDMTPESAGEAVHAAIESLLAPPAVPPALIYKKLDSALRGQLRSELAAAMRASGAKSAIVAPALPAEGRTTLGGHQHVHGVPLEESSFGRGGASGDLVATFRGDYPVTRIDLETLRRTPGAVHWAVAAPGIVICDAETDDDLETIARVGLGAGARLLAGSAGLARALVRVAPFVSTHRVPAWTPAAGKPVLVVAGTRHEASERQIAAAEQQGVAIFRPAQASLDDDGGDIATTIACAERALVAGTDVIVTLTGLQDSPLGAVEVVERLARIADSPVVRQCAGGMMVTGGDVAAAVCRRLGARAIWLRGEVQPAIPWGTLEGGALPGLPIVTKAGSFGGDDSIVASMELLKRKN